MSPRKAATAKAVTAKAVTAKAAATKSATKTSADRAKSEGKSEAKLETKSESRPAARSAANGSASAEATALAARIERDLRDGRSDTLTPQAFQALMAALCKSYGTQLEAGAQFPPLASQTSASPTEVMTTTSALLKAANLAVFELGMWQSWTGR
jgi:hypothetical protein